MLIYVSCDWDDVDTAKKITHELQIDDMENCYICPVLAFSHLVDKETTKKEKAEICLDLLSVCDILVVYTNSPLWETEEIQFANKVNMEVIYI